ncbi:MAG: hypothetical protein ABJN22_12445 [Litorimonas sp.]
MQKKTLLNRRSFVCSQIALATVSAFGLGGVAHAIEDQPNWTNATAAEFEKLTMQQFTAMTEDGQLFHLKLADVEAGNSGGARPKILPRSEGVVLTFDCDFADEFAANGDQSVWMWNSTLGKFNMHLGASLRRSGKYDLVAVLN